MSNPIPPDTIDEMKRLRSRGLNYKTIANRLQVSIETVRRYAGNIKLDQSILFDEDSTNQRVIAKPKATFAGRVARPSWFEENIKKMITSGR